MHGQEFPATLFLEISGYRESVSRGPLSGKTTSITATGTMASSGKIAKRSNTASAPPRKASGIARSDLSFAIIFLIEKYISLRYLMTFPSAYFLGKRNSAQITDNDVVLMMIMIHR